MVLPAKNIARYGHLRKPLWLRRHRYGPLVYVFRNLESGQCLYTQVPFPQQFYIDSQFPRPNWQNRLPPLRRDIWRPMAVAEMPDYNLALELYESLVQLRYMRDVTHKTEAMAMRKKNLDKNIWYSAQYRPTYTQEAVADLATCLTAFKQHATVWWESVWRKGHDDHWRSADVSHQEFVQHNVKNPFVVLKQISDQAYNSYRQRQLSKAGLDLSPSDFRASTSQSV